MITLVHRPSDRSPRGRCEPVPGRYFRHLTAMDGGNAGNEWNCFPAMAKDPRYDLSLALL
ncbi:hypothetical protein [Vreelandella zhanjiangensis]|uniref:hypothetical protein n=1 Tax=Vreelandella zhanjiangensis TaxID=1121960 RepID=UPI0012DC2F06|nr:hypothetical protein [Halomonas zhanjiangensis]